MVRYISPGHALMPLTEAEKRESLQVLDEIRLLRERLLRERGGREFPPAAEVFRALRDEEEQGQV